MGLVSIPTSPAWRGLGAEWAPLHLWPLTASGAQMCPAARARLVLAPMWTWQLRKPREHLWEMCHEPTILQLKADTARTLSSPVFSCHGPCASSDTHFLEMLWPLDPGTFTLLPEAPRLRGSVPLGPELIVCSGRRWSSCMNRVHQGRSPGGLGPSGCCSPHSTSGQCLWVSPGPGCSGHCSGHRQVPLVWEARLSGGVCAASELP